MMPKTCGGFHYQEATGIGEKLKANAGKTSVRLTKKLKKMVSCLLLAYYISVIQLQNLRIDK